MEIEERELMQAAEQDRAVEQDKAVPLGSLGGGEAAAHPGDEAAIAELQENVSTTLDDAVPSG
eukprot:806657-Lingulodinium_polyedra.AAC.1